MTADQSTMGYVAGLPAPTVFVTDGLLNRLEENERDAIVCHELAHIANGTMWGLAATMPVAVAVGTIALLNGVHTWLLIVPAVFVGLNRFLMRPLELDCDLRAARALGFVETTMALNKIHKLGLDGKGRRWLRPLVRATEVHPALPTRLAWLRKHAPPDQRDRFPEINDQSHSLAWVMAIAWALGVAIAWWLGRMTSWWAIGASGALLLATALTPMLIMYAAMPAQSLRRHMRGWNPDFVLTIAVVVVLAGIPFGLNQLAQSSMTAALYAGPVLSASMMAGLAVLIYFATRNSHHKTIQRDMTQAWNERDFERVLAASRKRPKVVRKDVNLGYMRASALAIMGNFPQSIIEFEQLIAEFPGMDLPIGLVAVLVEAGDLDRALTVSNSFAEQHPTIGIGQAMAARALRKMGRLDEAKKQLETSMALSPENGTIWAAAAGVAADLGNYDQAREYLRIANEKTPGSPQEFVEAARLAIRTEPPETAVPKLERAIAVLRDNPLLMRKSDLKQLQDELAQFSST